MIEFLDKHKNNDFLYGYETLISEYIKNEYTTKNIIIYFDKVLFFNYKEESDNINIKCYHEISEIDFIYNLIFNLSKENDWIDFIKNNKTDIIYNILEKSFNEKNTKTLKNIVLYEYKKRINEKHIEENSKIKNVRMVPTTKEKKLICLPVERINEIKKVFSKDKFEILNFLLIEINENYLNKLANEEFFEIYSAFLNKEKELNINNYYELKSLKEKILDLKDLSIKPTDSKINKIKNNSTLFNNLIKDFINKFVNNAEVEIFYNSYFNLKNNKRLIKDLNKDTIKQANIKKNEIIMGNSGTGKSYKVFNEESKSKNPQTNTINITDLNYDYFKSIIIKGMLDYFYIIIMDNNGRTYLPDHIKKNTRIIIDESNRNNFQELLNKFNFLIENDKYSKTYEIYTVKKEDAIILKNKYNFDYNFFMKNKSKNIDKEINTALLLLEVENLTLKKHLKEIIENFFYNKTITKDIEIPICSFPGLNFTLIMNTVDFNTKEIDLMLNRRCSIKYISYKIETNHKNFKVLKSTKDDLLFKENKKYEIIDWLEIQEAINSIIEEYCHDSKCIGYYFWTDYIKDNNNNIIMYEDFKNKIIYYLYGSVLNNFDKDYFKYNIRDEKNDYFFQTKKSFNKLMEAKNISDIFSINILRKINLWKNENENEIIKIKD